VFRTGASYVWLHSPEPSFENGGIVMGDAQSAHGVNIWLLLGLELLGGNRIVTPIIALAGEYTAVVSTDPIEHHLSAQGLVGLVLGRRMVFDRRGDEDEVEAEATPEAAEPEDIQLEEEDEERLREAEEDLRR
jgi:hypothetical protein